MRDDDMADFEQTLLVEVVLDPFRRNVLELVLIKVLYEDVVNVLCSFVENHVQASCDIFFVDRKKYQE